jgi:magnesium chelatase family protein
MHVEVTPVPINELADAHTSEKSEEVRKRVVSAREAQTERFKGLEIHCNAQMGSKILRDVCQLDDAGRAMLKKATDRLGLSARAFDRIQKVSRTIADLEGSDRILPAHLAEAIQYRSLDRANWAG